MLRNINCNEFLWIQTTIYSRSVNSLCSIRVITSVYLFNINAKMTENTTKLNFHIFQS